MSDPPQEQYKDLENMFDFFMNTDLTKLLTVQGQNRELFEKKAAEWFGRVSCKTKDNTNSAGKRMEKRGEDIDDMNPTRPNTPDSPENNGNTPFNDQEVDKMNEASTANQPPPNR